MSEDRTRPKRVECYTGAFLATSGVILFMALLTLAATLGYLAVLVAATAIDALIRVAGSTCGSRSRTG